MNDDNGQKDTKQQLQPHHKGNTASEIMNRHITNKNDVITDEDFKNLNVNPDDDVIAGHPLEINNDSDRPKDEDKDPAILTPWDTIKK